MANKYPLTYEEYEKRVIELLLESYPQEKQETIKNRLDMFLEDDPYFIKGLYNDTCFNYDHPEIYGENVKKAFDDEHLIMNPVRVLYMFLGGNFD